ESDPGDNYGAPGKFYPTIMALRFSVKDFSMIKITGPKGFSYAPQVPTIGNEGLLFIKVGPEEPDDLMHSHARYAFNQLISLFPTKALWTAFPLPKKDSVDETMMHSNVSRSISSDNRYGAGKDCRASMLLLGPGLGKP